MYKTDQVCNAASNKKSEQRQNKPKQLWQPEAAYPMLQGLGWNTEQPHLRSKFENTSQAGAESEGPKQPSSLRGPAESKQPNSHFFFPRVWPITLWGSVLTWEEAAIKKTSTWTQVVTCSRANHNNQNTKHEPKQKGKTQIPQPDLRLTIQRTAKQTARSSRTATALLKLQSPTLSFHVFEFFLHVNGLCDFIVCSDACQSALARTLQHPMACATKFPALGDDTKSGTVSPISSAKPFFPRVWPMSLWGSVLTWA